jgi:hypothetical protein
VKLTLNGKSLIVALLFRLLFGGYVVGMDQYHFNDFDSAVTVLLIYVLLCIFATLFLLGKKYGLVGLIALEAIFLVLNSVFFILTLGQITDAGMHDPLDNWWITLLRFSFSVMTLVLSIRVYRETK